MSRFHGSADRAVSTRRQIITPGPMMANVTVDVYHEERDHHRDMMGGKFFPGTVDDYTMFFKDFELIFMFKDGSTRPSVDYGSGYSSHVGYPSFTVLNGIKNDKFWMYNNLDLVGVTKSHTTLNDRTGNQYTQTAAFRGGSCSLIHTGTEIIPVNCEFKVVIYDAVHDPKKFKDLYEAPSKRDAGRVRILAAIEPYHKNDDIVSLLHHYHPATGSASRPAGHKRVLFGQKKEDGQFTVESISERIIAGSGGVLVLGFLLGNFFQDRPGDTIGSSAQVRARFRRYLNAMRESQISEFINAVFSQGMNAASEPHRESGASKFIAGMLLPQTSADMIEDNKAFRARKGSMLTTAIKAQNHSSILYPSLKDLRTWETKWVVGLSQHTAHPNGVMDIIIRR